MHHSMVHCELCLWLSWSLAYSRESSASYAWLGSIMDNISVYYTRTFLHVQSRFRGASGAHGRRGSLVPYGSASPALATYSARGGWEAGPAPSLRLPAASVAWRRLTSSQRRLRPTRGAALVDRTALRTATASGWRICGRGLGTHDHRRGLRRLGPVGDELSHRHRSVEGAVDRAYRRARERVRRCEASGQGGAGRRARGGRGLKLARGGKGRPLTRGR